MGGCYTGTAMKKRLQVQLDADEYVAVHGAARREGVTVSEWVREALRRACKDERPQAVEAKLRVIADASRHEFPTADIDIVLQEIEAGRRQQ